MEELSYAKVKVMLHPNAAFISTGLLSLQTVLSREIETASVMGRVMTINPDWFLGLAPKERMGVLVHETWHVLLMHVYRRGNRDQKKWQRACDYAANGLVREAGFVLLEGTLYDSKYRDMSAEQIYDLLEDEDDDEQDPIGGDLPPTITSDPEAIDNIMQVVHKSAIAAQAGNQAGTIPGNLELLIQEFTNPTLPWEVILEQFFNERANDDYSWSKRNKRYPDVYLPSLYSERLGRIRFFVDISCSVTDDEFAAYLSQIVHVQEQFNPEIIEVHEFDTQLYEPHILMEGESARDIVFTGRGGTDINPVFDYIRSNEPALANVIFTDGGFHMPPTPDGTIIWIIDKNKGFTCDSGLILHVQN